MPLEIITATSQRDIRRFVDLPWQIYTRKDHPHWVPPLRLTVLDALDRTKPFYREAERALFLAVRDGRVVGRIAAIENRTHNAFHKDRVGFWGFFESIDDQEVVNRLFAAAGAWLAARGLDTMRGPVMPSTNYDCGLLVDGFDVEPTFMTPWNGPSYATMIEKAGHVKAKDLVAYFIPLSDPNFPLPDSFVAFATRAKAKMGLTVRTIDFSRWNEELERFWDIYNSAWEVNWGFVPMSKDEFIVMAKDLKPLLRADCSFIAEVAGKPAAFMLNVPDFNPVLKRIGNGRLFPTGLLRLLLGKSKIRTWRVMALGVKKEFRSRSIFPLLVHESFNRGAEINATGADLSWILEDNELLLGPLRGIGLKEYRRWRIYDGPTVATQA